LKTRDEDGSADGAAPISLIETWLVDLVRCGGIAIVEPGIGIHAVVTAEAIERTMKVFGSAAGHGADLCVGRASVFGLVVRSEHLEFRDRVEIQSQGRSVVAGVHDGDAIESEIVGAAAQAVRENVRDRVARSVVGIEDDSGHNRSEWREPASVHRDAAQDFALQT